MDSYFPMSFPLPQRLQIQTMPLGMWTKSEQTDEHAEIREHAESHAEIRDEIETASRLSSWPCSSDSDTMENADEIETASDVMLRRLSRRSIPGDGGAGELGRLGCRGRVGRLEPRRCIDGELAIDPPPPGLIRPLSRGLWANCLRGSTPTFAGSMRVPARMAEAILSRDRNATFTGSTKTPWCCGHRK